MKKQYVTHQDRTSIFLVIICIVWTVTQECTAEDVGQKAENVLYCYECTTYRKNKGCYFHGVPEKYLETEVLQAIQSVIYNGKCQSR